jgi:hypothetical protein
MLALAYLAVTRARLAGDTEPRPAEHQVISSASEIRRMFTALCSPPPSEQHARRWSRWRQHHQERSRQAHYKRQRLSDHDLRLEYLEPRSAPARASADLRPVTHRIVIHFGPNEQWQHSSTPCKCPIQAAARNILPDRAS